VKGTPFDFTTATAIGARIGQSDAQLKLGNGYDHNWVLNKGKGGLTKAAEAFEPKTGRVMEVWTTEPGLQFYTGNFLDGSVRGKGGKVYPFRSAVLHGDAALSGFAQQAQLPHHGAEAGEHLPHHDDLPLLGAIIGFFGRAGRLVVIRGRLLAGLGFGWGRLGGGDELVGLHLLLLCALLSAAFDRAGGSGRRSGS